MQKAALIILAFLLSLPVYARDFARDKQDTTNSNQKQNEKKLVQDFRTDGFGNDDSNFPGWINMKKISVLDFIKLLTVDTTRSVVCHCITTVNKADSGWVKESDLDTLIKLIDSERPSNCIVQSISSHLPLKEQSTIGGQAMNIIDAFRFKKNFPDFTYLCSKNDEKRKQEILAWYREYKKMK